MSNLVVVALPAQNDYIWQVSSEKVPHLTLLFLGEDGAVENTQGIVEFVEHAAHGLNPFYMEADYRGTLGADDADVLFFDQGGSSFKTISEFRSQLLKNAAIKAAYNSVEQFPEWTPHLTLGYPATPAKTPDKDRTIYSVEFDRIAVWTSDSDGPEFRLKYEPGRWDAPLSMSAEDAKTLLHYGVKGMKWGQRNTAKSDMKWADKQMGVKTDTSGTVRKTSSKPDWKIIKTVNKANKKNVAAINNKPEWKEARKSGVFKPPKKGQQYKPGQFDLLRKYDNEIADAWMRELNKHVDSLPVSPSGNKKLAVKTDSPGGHTWYLHTVDVKHDDFSVKLRVIRDGDGFITDIEFSDDTMAQGQALVEREFSLTHYGVKGMHWGQRMAGIKANAAKREEATQTARREKFAPKDVTVKSSLNEKGKRKVKVTGGTHHDLHEDAVAAKSHKQKAAKSGLDSLSNKELQQLANRMNLEQQVRRLSNADPKPSKGFVHDLIVNAGKKKVTDLANDPDNFEKLIKLAMK